MRLASFAAPALMLLLADAAPRCGAPPPPRLEKAPAVVKQPSPKPAPAAEAPAAAPDAPAAIAPSAEAPVDAGVEATLVPPTASELAALNDYAAFSRDGLLFVYTQMSVGAGLFVANVMSSTTNTIEKTVLLEDDAVRRTLIEELDAEGFPRPGHPQKIPPEVKATVNNGQVSVSFGPAPAAKPWKPFASTPGIVATRTEVVAVSPSGDRVAVRSSARDQGEFGAPIEYRVVNLFE